MLQETVSSERHQQLPTVFWNSNRMPFLESYLCVMLVITVSMLMWIFLLHFLCVNRMIRNAKLWWRCVYNNRPRRNTDRSLYGEPKICLWQLVQHISRSSSFIQFDCPAFTVLFRDNANSSDPVWLICRTLFSFYYIIRLLKWYSPVKRPLLIGTYKM